MHPALFVGLLLDGLLVVAGFDAAALLGWAMLASWVVAAAGAFIIAARPRVGRPLVIAGSVLFVPIGLVAVWGMAGTLDRRAEHAAQARWSRS
jgi:hypothetical protein